MAKFPPGTEESAHLSGEDVALVQRELGAILQSDTFKRSRCSQEFLQYTVDNALDGRSDELKERVVGSVPIRSTPAQTPSFGCSRTKHDTTGAPVRSEVVA